MKRMLLSVCRPLNGKPKKRILCNLCASAVNLAPFRPVAVSPIRPFPLHPFDGTKPRADKNLAPKRLIAHTLLTRWLHLAAYCLAIFLQSSGPAPEALPQFPYADKLLHAAAYGLLAILFFRAYCTIWPPRFAVAGLSILSAGLYGALDELHQSFVPVRSAEGFDLLADFFGAGVGMLLYWRYARRTDIRVDKKNRIG
jgi:VanZ family protein